MKTKLLLALVLTSFIGFSQTFDNIPTGTGIYINKLIPSPNTDDLTNEYFEFRGTPNATVPSNLYLIMIEGDGESGKTDMGKVKEVVELGDGTRTFGSNGFLVLVANYNDINGSLEEEDEAGLSDDTDDGEADVLYTNPYASVIDANATVITVLLEGREVTSSKSAAVISKSPSIGYDGNFTDASGTYMLISSSSDPKDHDLDSDNDGVINATGDHTSWVLYDSVTYMDDNDEGQGEYGYGQLIFAQSHSTLDAVQYTTTSANVFDYQGSSDINLILRQGTNIGYTAADWVGANASGSSPNWEFSSTSSKVTSAGFVNYDLPDSIFGELNPTDVNGALSTNEVLASEFSIYPNPAKDNITITSQDYDVTGVEVYNLVGGKVLEQSELNNDNLDVSGLSKGVYILKINTKNGSLNQRIVIQ